MNEVLKTIANRYSCRAFSNKMPSDEDFKKITNAAISAPSSTNTQPWRIIVLQNKELLSDIETEALKTISGMEDKTIYNRILSRGGKLFYNAPSAIFIPISSPDKNRSLLDCGIVCQTIALATESLGLGSVICGLAGLAFTAKKTAEFNQRLGFPDGYEIGATILIGYSNLPHTPHETDSSKISFID